MTLKPKTFTLRDYQNWGVDYLLEDLPNNLVPVLESRWKALIVATAGGKTKILNAAAKLASENPNIKGVLLITPHLHISQTFQGHEVYRYTKPGDLNPVVVEVTSSFWGILYKENPELRRCIRFKTSFKQEVGVRPPTLNLFDGTSS